MPYLCLPVGALSTNCYIVYDDSGKGVVVDPGDEASRILDAIKDKNLQIEYILLTHVHFDHFLAAKEVQEKTKARLLVPFAEGEALNDPMRSLLHFAGGAAALKADTPLKVEKLLKDGDVITAGSLRFEVLHTPGHSPGSSCFLCREENLLLSGDTLFAGDIGRADLPGGDFATLRRSLERLSNLEGEYTVLPGHGPSTTLMEEQDGNPYMNASGYASDY